MDIVLIGAGNMAIAYAKVLQNLGLSFRCCGRGKASAANFQANTGIPAGTGDLSDQLKSSGIDGALAIVAVDISQLSGVCTLLLSAGARSILVEKPGGINLKDMKRMAEADDQNRIRVAYNRRFLKSAQKALEIIEMDGGVQTVHFEFTELPDRIEALGVHPAEVLANLEFANSSHVFDLAFYLGQAAEDLNDVLVSGATKQGQISWHPQGSRYAACGTISDRSLFTCFADWRSGGNWSVEVSTNARRLRLRPLETLTEQRRESFEVSSIQLEAEPDGLKPGLHDMVANFVFEEGRLLPTMRQQAERMTVFSRVVARTD